MDHGQATRVRQHFRVLLLVLLLLNPCSLLAQGDTLISIPSVAVYGLRAQGDSRHLDLNTLRSFSSDNVAEALRFLAGVQVKDYGGVGGLRTVNVRSLGSAHLGVSYDGAPILETQNGVVDLGGFSLHLVDHISLSTGTPTSRFSSARESSLGAQVSLQAAFLSDKAHRRHLVRLGGTFGEFGLLSPQIYYQGRCGQRVQFSLNASLTKTHGRYPFRYVGYNSAGKKVYDTTAIRQNGDLHRWQIENGWYGRMARGAWRLRLYTYSAEQGLPGAIVSNVWRRGERLATLNTFLQGSIRQELTPHYASRLVGKLSYSKTHYHQLDPHALYEALLYQGYTGYLSWQHHYQVREGLTGALAYDVQWEALRAKDAVRGGSPLTPPQPSRTLHYLAGRLGWHPRLFSFQASLTGVRTPRGGWHLLPSLWAQYAPTTSFALHSYARQSLRAPSFNELYYTGWGSATLAPERATQYALGFNSQGGGMTLRSELYYAEVKNKIIVLPANSQFHWRTFNLGKSRLWGIESAWQGRYPIGGLGEVSLRLQYTYSRAIDLSNPRASYYRHQLPYTPWHSGSLTLSYAWRGFSLHSNTLYTGERYHQSENSVYNYEPAWYTTDLRLCYKWVIFASEIELGLDINNLLDQPYAVVLNYPMPGRHLRGNISITF